MGTNIWEGFTPPPFLYSVWWGMAELHTFGGGVIEASSDPFRPGVF